MHGPVVSSRRICILLRGRRTGQCHGQAFRRTVLQEISHAMTALFATPCGDRRPSERGWLARRRRWCYAGSPAVAGARPGKYRRCRREGDRRAWSISPTSQTVGRARRRVRAAGQGSRVTSTPFEDFFQDFFKNRRAGRAAAACPAGSQNRPAAPRQFARLRFHHRSDRPGGDQQPRHRRCRRNHRRSQ